jgi:hypothetical protein
MMLARVTGFCHLYGLGQMARVAFLHTFDSKMWKHKRVDRSFVIVITTWEVDLGLETPTIAGYRLHQKEDRKIHIAWYVYTHLQLRVV